MKIIDAISKKEFDTDKMPDVSSELTELLANNVALFLKYKVPMMMIYKDPSRPSASAGFNFNDDVENVRLLIEGLNGLFHDLKWPYEIVAKSDD
jgi:hypothetical protein